MIREFSLNCDESCDHEHVSVVITTDNIGRDRCLTCGEFTGKERPMPTAEDFWG